VQLKLSSLNTRKALAMSKELDAMSIIRLIWLPCMVGIALSACQTPQSRADQLATICADPANRQPNTLYFSECQSLYPSTNRQLQKDYRLNAVTGDD
jgi:hypothetical protein